MDDIVGQRFRGACFVFKFALQREEGEKSEGVQISTQGTQNLWPKKSLQSSALYFPVGT